MAIPAVALQLPSREVFTSLIHLRERMKRTIERTYRYSTGSSVI